MNKFESFLSTVGKDVKKGLDVILPFAEAATPFIAIANPAVGGILQTTIAVVVATEQKFTAMGQQDKSGPAKLAESVTILEPAVKQAFAQAGIEIDTSHVQNYINAVVALLNSMPAVPAASK